MNILVVKFKLDSKNSYVSSQTVTIALGIPMMRFIDSITTSPSSIFTTKLCRAGHSIDKLTRHILSI